LTDRELLRHIERSAGQRAGYKQLVREFGLGGGRDRRLLVEHLARLTASGRLTKVDREQWALARVAATRDNLIAGRLDMHRDGFGFVRVTGESRETGDIFIPPGEMAGAMQGDQVLVELVPPGRDGRRSGRVARVLTRSHPTVVGIFRNATNEHQQGHQVVPFDDKMTQPVLIPFDAPLPSAGPSVHRVLGDKAASTRAITSYEDLEGLAVDVEVFEFPTPSRVARGRVVEVLGDPDGFGVDVEVIIRKHHLPRVFPDAVLKQAREVAGLDGAEVERRVHLGNDFRGLPIVTIDGETARDFDDAVLVREQADGGWELQVHIADVAEYVRPATDLDLEARLRGNSVYFPDRAIPMLPHELSSGICSLRPDEDRLVLSCLMQIGLHGEVLGYEVVEGVIRSARRMTYTQVATIIDPERDGHEAMRAEFAELVPEFEAMQRLAHILHAKRERRGSIDFDLPEPVIEFDEQGAMQGVRRSERNWANRLIEEFMLAANECVASWIENLGVESLYRIHEKPDPRRIVDFEDTAAGFGYSLGLGALAVKRFQPKAERREFQSRGGKRPPRAVEVPDDMPVTPKMYQKLAMKIAGKPEERILSYLMLRSLKQARYSEKNEGHFALAAPCYTHFTSPIRRYPDLVVHRIAKALLAAGVSRKGVLATGEPHGKGSAWDGSKPPVRRAVAATGPEILPASELAAIAQESSENERRAAAAERELVEWKKIRFMESRVGEEFDALILTVSKYGLFVELDTLFIEGLVPLMSLGALDGDAYVFHENTREIIGEVWARKFAIGNRVRVALERVNAIEKRLQFAIVLDEDLLETRRPGKAKKVRPAKPAKKSMQQSTKSRIPAPGGKKTGRKKRK
jgi:ribonuclease R